MLTLQSDKYTHKSLKERYMKTTIKILLAMFIATFAAGKASAQIPDGYYDSLKGKKGAALKNAIHELIGTAKTLSYGDGDDGTWWGFYVTDNDNGYVVDRYSNERRKFGSRGSAVSGMNIEHSFPKSWWGGSKNQAYRDLFNLMPSDEKANSSKSNYGMGVVTNATYDNGCIKIGSSAQGFKVWQPSKEWQGDFSRDYMYMVTAYQNLTWKSEATNSLQQGDYPTLKEWAYKLYIKWAKEDPVNATEVARNNAVYKIQGNRNPYIDFPNLMEYVWGDSVNYAFDPNNTVCSENYKGDGGGGVDPTPGETTLTLYAADYKTSDGRCTIETEHGISDDVEVWTRTTQYGWKGTGYVSATSKRYATDASLLTPEIDLTDCESATLAFTHAERYDTAPTTRMSVEVRCDGNTTKLGGINWPSGNNWDFVESGDISLNAFAGKKIRIAFHYTSTTSVAGTWEISSATVTGTKASTGIGSVKAAAQFDASKPYEMFDIAGRKLGKDYAAKGIVIVRQNGNTFKMKR